MHIGYDRAPRFEPEVRGRSRNGSVDVWLESHATRR